MRVRTQILTAMKAALSGVAGFEQVTKHRINAFTLLPSANIVCKATELETGERAMATTNDLVASIIDVELRFEGEGPVTWDAAEILTAAAETAVFLDSGLIGLVADVELVGTSFETETDSGKPVLLITQHWVFQYFPYQPADQPIWLKDVPDRELVWPGE